ncbi:hypothetical protein [Polycladidibacter hongkongensis]|uniref:hypothetical protein n=1 Tax=Polycladidibacter hongkongensis TaxID=1647556 RepID=UPI000834AF8B|nr:hypothetical protein [Pseudovibrio hongkongensis]
MESWLSALSPMPHWMGVIFLVAFALSGSRFRTVWKHKPQGWQMQCTALGLIATLCFAMMVFGDFGLG